MANKIRVLVVDDSSFMRNMLVRMIEKDPQERFEVVDTAVNGQDGVEKVKALKPDVITLDVEMPIMSGLEALEIIMKECPTPTLMISTLTESGAATTMDALNKGAVDFLPKALKDKDKNIFSAADAIYAKIEAAAVSNVGQKANIRAAAQPVAAAPSLTPPTSGVTKFPAKMVVVGSSTGGPRALQTFIKQLPATLNVPVVIAQHMPAEFTSALAMRLNELARVTVKELEQGEALQRGTVYIAPGGFHTRIQGGMFDVRPDAGESPFKPSVDVLAASALMAVGEQIIAVMLTGMGRDGADAFLKIKEKGGHVIAQDAATSTVYGMPRAVAENGAATEVLPLENIGTRLATLLG